MIMMTMIDAGKTGLERVVERAPDNRYGQTRFSPSWSKVDNIRTEEVSIISRSSQICFLGNATHLEWKQFLESRIYRAYLCSSASSSNILVRQRLWHFYSFVTRLFSSGQKKADALKRKKKCSWENCFRVANTLILPVHCLQGPSCSTPLHLHQKKMLWKISSVMSSFLGIISQY